MQKFYSNGKLLLSGEYLVLDGAVALAIPTSYGQTLQVTEQDKAIISWRSIAVDQTLWFEVELDAYSLEIKNTTETSTARTLQKILRQATKLNHGFLYGSQGYIVESSLGFKRNWGLGSSSTLIHNIAQWAQIDSYQLLWNSFSGSGYDIACAQTNSPILYQLKDGQAIVEEKAFNPSFRDQLFFIHLNKKQNSRDGIAQYRKQGFDKTKLISQISEISQKLLISTSLAEFEGLLNLHEQALSENLNLRPVKTSTFPDYWASIKSLGAWGGDFILATGNSSTPAYFKEKGYNTVIPFSEMIL